MEAMLRLLLRGIALRAMSMEAIVGKAGVGKATLYRRWPSKDALLLHLLERLEAETEEGTDLTEYRRGTVRSASRRASGTPTSANTPTPTSAS